METSDGNYPWTKKNGMYLIHFFPLAKSPRSISFIRSQANILKRLRRREILFSQKFLTLRRKLSMVCLIMVVLLWVKRIRVVQ